MATIKAGTYRFNDVLTSTEVELNANFDFTVEVSVYGYEGVGHCDSITVTAELMDSAGMPFWYNTMRYNVVDLAPPFEYVSTPTTLLMYQTSYFDGGIGGIWETDVYNDGIKTITIPKDQEVSAEFYDWLTANAEPIIPAATITHNGEVIAELNAGQTATLKCAGMKMAGDVVVAVSENVGGDANIVPLIVGDAGTYDANSPVIVTETFTGGGEPDVVYNFWGTNIPCFKAKKLIATKDIFCLAYNEDLAEKLYADLFGDVIPICQLDLNRGFSDTSLVAMMSGVPAIIWVIATDETDFTKEAGFEDGGVYILDAWSLMGAEGVASLTALGIPDNPVDGFMPVEVAIPLVDELIVEAGISGRTFNEGYYKKVIVHGFISQHLTITPTTSRQTFYPTGENYYIGQVIVEPMDLSDLTKHRVLCGIYIDHQFTKTEYVYGEYFEPPTIVTLYTNGEKGLQPVAGTACDGWGQVKGPGTYTITVNREEGGIKTQTTYQINVAAP